MTHRPQPPDADPRAAAAPSGPSPVPANTPDDIPAAARIRALVVDDEPSPVRAVVGYLERDGFAVTTGVPEPPEVDPSARPHRYYRSMPMTSSGHDPGCGVDLGPAVALFRSLGDATRLGIVHELARGERRVVDLTRALGSAQSTVSTHLACLRDCGLVEGRPVGRQMLYRLSHPQLLTVLGAAEQLLAATGAAVALCPVYGDAHADVVGDVHGHGRPAVGA